MSADSKLSRRFVGPMEGTACMVRYVLPPERYSWACMCHAQGNHGAYATVHAEMAEHVNVCTLIGESA